MTRNMRIPIGAPACDIAEPTGSPVAAAPSLTAHGLAFQLVPRAGLGLPPLRALRARGEPRP
jgi:hypothetical protein